MPTYDGMPEDHIKRLNAEFKEMTEAVYALHEELKDTEYFPLSSAVIDAMSTALSDPALNSLNWKD